MMSWWFFLSKHIRKAFNITHCILILDEKLLWWRFLDLSLRFRVVCSGTQEKAWDQEPKSRVSRASMVRSVFQKCFHPYEKMITTRNLISLCKIIIWLVEIKGNIYYIESVYAQQWCECYNCIQEGMEKNMDQCILSEFDINENDVIHKGHHIQWLSSVSVSLVPKPLKVTVGGGGHTAEVNGPAERRKKSCALRSSQEAEQVKVLLPAFYCLQYCCGCLLVVTGLLNLK